MVTCTCAPDLALFESGARDNARKGEATTEKCIDQTVTKEKAKIRQCTSQNSVANSIRTRVYRM